MPGEHSDDSRAHIANIRRIFAGNLVERIHLVACIGTAEHGEAEGVDVSGGEARPVGEPADTSLGTRIAIRRLEHPLAGPDAGRRRRGEQRRDPHVRNRRLGEVVDLRQLHRRGGAGAACARITFNAAPRTDGVVTVVDRDLDRQAGKIENFTGIVIQADVLPFWAYCEGGRQSEQELSRSLPADRTVLVSGREALRVTFLIFVDRVWEEPSKIAVTDAAGCLDLDIDGFRPAGIGVGDRDINALLPFLLVNSEKARRRSRRPRAPSRRGVRRLVAVLGR